MPRPRSNQDVNQMTESLMIDLFKRIIIEAKMDLEELKDGSVQLLAAWNKSRLKYCSFALFV